VASPTLAHGCPILVPSRLRSGARGMQLIVALGFCGNVTSVTCNCDIYRTYLEVKAAILKFLIASLRHAKIILSF
jgi:hypothetical protein